MTTGSIGVGRGLFRLALGLAALLGTVGPTRAQRANSASMATVPREWRQTNPWGPEANAARAAGQLPPRFYTRRMRAWAEFGCRTVQEGDVLFRMGLSRTLTGNLSSRFVGSISDDRFSHDGIAHWEDGVLYVYDAVPEPEGVRKIPFEFWMLDVADHSLVIKRLKPPFRHYIPGAIAYCEAAYQLQIPFDSAMRLDDERLYCTEMIEKAFRSAGLALSDPVPIRCLPHYRRYAFLRPVAERSTEFRVDVPIFAVGNETYGTFGSPYLETVYDDGSQRFRCHRPKPPTCCPVPFREPGPLVEEVSPVFPPPGE